MTKQASTIKSGMSKELKGAVTIESAEKESADSLSLKPAIAIEQVKNWQELVPSNGLSPNDDTHQNLPKRSRLARFFLPFCLGVLILSVVELVLFIQSLYLQQDWMATLWLVVSAVFFIFIMFVLFKEWRGLRRLKNQQQARAVAQHLFEVPAIGLGRAHCLVMAESLPSSEQNSVESWQAMLQEHHTDAEVLSLFEQEVMSQVDDKALACITKNAGAASVMIAVSPFALLDMAIVLWRNVRMLNQISEIYGISIGYWGRISLIRRIFRTMLYAGAAEIVSDAGNYTLGAGISGGLSTRVAQGMGAGVLSARIGLKTMQECRPMPWLSIPKPGLAEISKKLLSDLNKHMS